MAIVTCHRMSTTIGSVRSRCRLGAHCLTFQFQSLRGFRGPLWRQKARSILKKLRDVSAKRSGFRRAGRRILSHIKNSLTFLSRDEALKQDGEFWSVPDRSVSFIRNRRMATLPLRKAIMIAPAEYQLAISTAIKEAVAISRDDLVTQAARLFGFDRTGADLKQEIEQQVDALIRAKAIIDDGQKVRMAYARGRLGAGTAAMWTDHPS